MNKMMMMDSDMCDMYMRMHPQILFVTSLISPIAHTVARVYSVETNKPQHRRKEKKRKNACANERVVLRQLRRTPWMHPTQPNKILNHISPFPLHLAAPLSSAAKASLFSKIPTPKYFSLSLLLLSSLSLTLLTSRRLLSSYI
jgi:hypothetical protein